MHGPLAGATLEVFPITITTVSAERAKHPDTRAAQSHQRLHQRLFSAITARTVRRRGFLPPGFASTMGPPDPRLPRLAPGLGVIVGDVQRFYPMDRIATPVQDTVAGRALTVSIDDDDGIPRAVFDDGGEPMQIMLRWFGFAYSYPGCEVFGEGRGEPGSAPG